MKSNKNKTLVDVSNILFDQFEKVSDCNLKGDEFDLEVKRMDSMVHGATAIAKNAEVILRAAIASNISLDQNRPLPNQFGLTNNKVLEQ